MDVTLADRIEPRERRGFIHRLLRHRNATIGLAILVAVTAACIFGPIIWAKNPTAIDFAAFGKGPSLHHLMGADDLGRDELTRILYGGRISILVGFLSMVIGIGIGAVVGAVSGWLGGAYDFALMRAVDVALSIPSLFLLLLLSVVFPPGVLSIAFIIGLTNWMRPARLMRSQVLTIKPREYVEAAHAIGSPPWRILLRTITPNAVAPLIVDGTLLMGQAIITEAVMSFLGFGIQPPTPSWGNMLTNAQTFIVSMPWLAIFPGFMVFITVLGFNLVGDGLRDAL
ncbi:MAG TPA: ABC transporter permease [Candidatus Dormibacteraeota bacterium]|nr:ABC transporter permease [Candidatus Dormibacteraeota bacterium]